jgi:hypothetical protein
MRCRLLLTVVVLLTSLASAQERKEMRILYDFESATDLESIKPPDNNITFDIVQDNGVTHGDKCCRVVFKKGGESSFFLSSEQIKNWSKFDYFAVDVYSEREEKVRMVLEFMDAHSKPNDYPTRCTFDEIHGTFENNIIKQGKNTIVFEINHAKRNNKEGREWQELEANDKMAMDALTKVKLFVVPPEGSDLTLWIDNMRLLQEDALGGKMKIELPAGAKAFGFGNGARPNFAAVPAGTKYDDAKGFGFTSGNVENCGKHWPDALTGDGVFDPRGGEFSVDVKLPDGEYCALLAAGMAINPAVKTPHFFLKIGAETICDEKPGEEVLNSEKYLFRFMNTQYSERENALFLDYIDRMYPVFEKKVKVENGKLTVSAANHFLAALIVLPAAQEAEFKKLAATIRAERIHIFYSGLRLEPQKKPQKKDGDGAYLCYVPDQTREIGPASAPSDAERAGKSIDLAAAPGQRLTFRVAVTPFENLGKCRLALSALKGPAEIPVSAARIYFQDYRVRGEGVGESALMPSAEINIEKGVSWCWWAWLKVPDDAKPGEYSAMATITPANGAPATLPVKLTVYPIKLEDNLPYSFGMYYNVPNSKKLAAEQLEFMREIGLNAVEGEGLSVTAVSNDAATVQFDTSEYELAKAAGMGRSPEQFSILYTLSSLRSIGRKMGYSGDKLDANPGFETTDPHFKALSLDFAKKAAPLLKQCPIPVLAWSVDEPRETPNPWNRTLLHTNMINDWLHEGGIFPVKVTPMGDTQGGKDYTPLVDHTDVIATHAGKGSEKLMTLAIEKKKILWLYNTGMDRLSWGFYNWRVGSKGRWEWHFCFWGPGTNNGYVNGEEWYNPFTLPDGFAPHAPANNRGAMLFKSVYLTASEGITDCAYITTLEKVIAAADGNAAKAATVAKAREFLDGLKKKIPFLPDVQGIASAAEGAAVGKGLSSRDAEFCEDWRRQIAAFLIELK